MPRASNFSRGPTAGPQAEALLDGNHSLDDDDEDTAAATSKSSTGSPLESRRNPAAWPAGRLEARRKLSQSSSQVCNEQNCCSLTESSRRCSSIGQCHLTTMTSQPTGRTAHTGSQRLQIEMLPLFNGSGHTHDHRQLAGLATINGHADPSGMRRTISRSMLELDKSLGSEPIGARSFQVSWSNLSFEYQPGRLGRLLKGRRAPRAAQPVLDELSGSFQSNQLVAVIGPSGCGKTTLLQFLAGNNGHAAGRLRISGLREPKVALIGQDDSLLPGLTASETLVYASRLQNQTRSANFDHLRHVQPILTELGLAECAHRNVTKLSGGQAKRVTIAQELLYPTNLLILDEVTSGLDAATSFAIVKLLKCLVSDRTYPMSIVMSIHQPSARLFAVFDRVYLMAEGGCLYEGGARTDLISAYLGQFGLACPQFHNIADYLIEIASDDSLEAARKRMIKHQRKLHASARLEDVCEEAAGRVTCGASPNGLPAGARLSSSSSSECLASQADCSLYEAVRRARRRRPRPLWAQLSVHLRRSLLRIRRSYILTYLQLVTYIALGLQLATFYGPTIGLLGGCPRLPGNLIALVLSTSSAAGSPPDCASGEPAANGVPVDQLEEQAREMRRIQENMNFLLVVVMTATFAALEITVITFPMEAKTVKREWRNGWYRTTSYFLGRTLAELPFTLVFVLIFSLIVYSMTGQLGLDSWRFASFVLVLIMVALVAQSFGFMFGAIFMDNLPAAVFAAPLCIFPTLLFSGFFARVSQIPALYRPLSRVSHFRYAFDALIVTLYGRGRCDCDQDSLASYHANLANQTESMREMFRYLFGSNDCPAAGGDSAAHGPAAVQAAAWAAPAGAPPAPEMDAQHLEAIRSANSSLGEALAKLTAPAASTAAPALSSQLSKQISSIEDVLVERVFSQLTAAANSSSTSTTTDAPLAGVGEPADAGPASGGITDQLAYEFGAKVTNMLNRQSNFGHSFPESCDNFKSYLLTEFGLSDADLIAGLACLLVMVLASRLLCGLVLNHTISARTK